MIVGCVLGNENCFDMEIRFLYCYKILFYMDKSIVEEKNRRVFFFFRMVMNDLMGEDKKVSVFVIIQEWDIKGDLKFIVREWKYQRERMGKNNRFFKYEISEMISIIV